jgi:hypothetical protein
VTLVLDDWFIALLAIATGVLGVGRLTRILVHDDFPPSIWLRMQWDRITRDGSWSKLVHCPWCASVWMAFLCVGTWIGGMYVEWLAWAWWIAWGSLAIAYVATMIYVRDEPSDE